MGFNPAIAAGEDLDEDITDCDDKVVNDVSISDQESNFLAELHSAMYAKKATETSDLSRVQAFVLTYTAASLLNHITSRSNAIQSECNRFNAHCFAVGLHSINAKGIPFSTATMNLSTEDILDFHRDPNPVEVLKAYKPLKGLLHRISQLLRAFPGNAILIAIASDQPNSSLIARKCFFHVENDSLLGPQYFSGFTPVIALRSSDVKVVFSTGPTS